VAVGRERLRQILHGRGISFQRTRTWKESTDPDRDAKLDRIEYVTSKYPDRCFGFDQFGPLSIRPVHGGAWAERKRPVRLPATYHRTHGIRYFHGCYCVGDDQLCGFGRRRRSLLRSSWVGCPAWSGLVSDRQRWRSWRLRRSADVLRRHLVGASVVGARWPGLLD